VHGWFINRPTLAMAIWFAAILWLVSSRVSVWGQEPAKPTASSRSTTELDLRISHLIEQLGDPLYSNRIGAQAELERIGVFALDQLHSASFHPDPQIASTARYIVQSNQFSWAWESDPANVRQILSSYADSHISEKSVYIDQLDRLEHDQGFGALCRLVRYETQGSLAKRAALLLMRSKPVIDQTLDERKEALLNQVAGGQSQASRWVLKYAANEPDFDLPWWKQVLQEELALLKSTSVDANIELVTDLHRWVAEQVATKPAYREQALAIGRSVLTLAKAAPTLDAMTGSRTVRANQYAQWALKCRLPELVQEQHGKLPFLTVAREYVFGYYLAESFAIQGNEQLANEVADRSLRQIPCKEDGTLREPSDSEKRDNGRGLFDSAFDRRSASQLGRRWTLASGLQERGLFEWAEAEYRAALTQESPEKTNEMLDMTQGLTLRAMRDFAAMLHSLGRYRDAVAVLEPFMKRFQNEPMFQKQMVDWSAETETIQTNYHLYLADASHESGDDELARKEYWASLATSDDNVDALIGLYRLAADEQEINKRRDKLKETISEMRLQIRKDEESLKLAPNQILAVPTYLLANKCNSLAWMIANTEGNKEEALFLSRKACSLAPEHAEFLDTLAHCYASLDRYPEAVEQQRRAVELKPHHPELKRALAKFESILQQKKNR
jgi:tetratricopeptide (TPR) repeat protein